MGDRTDVSINDAERLIALSRHAAACDVSQLDADAIRHLVDAIQHADQSLTALKVRAGQRANQLAAAGQGPDANDAFLRSGGSTSRQARRDAARTQAVDDNPALGNHLVDGRINGEHLDAVARVRRTVQPELQPQFDDAVSDLTNRNVTPNPDAFNTQLRRIADAVADDHGATTARKQREQSELRTWTNKNDGMGHLSMRLDPERFASVVNAIERHANALAASATSSGEPVTRGPGLNATALVELIQAGNGAPGRPDMLVLVDADSAIHGPHANATRQTRDGADLSHDTVARLACDCFIRRVVIDSDGVVIDVGRRYRTATDAQWVALNTMYTTCAWAGCDRPISWCQAHHIHEWTKGGPTDLDNLIPLCSRHHHRVHEGKWTLKLLPDRTLKIFQPDGTHWANAAPDRLTDERHSPGLSVGDKRRLTHN